MEARRAIKVNGVHKLFGYSSPHTNIKSIFTSMIKGGKKRSADSFAILEGISLDVYEGEFLGIVGKNGSGKSTLLKLIAGIYAPTKGKVTVRGKLVPFIELGVGFNPDLTGKENVYLNGALLGFSKKEIDARYQDIVDFAELEKFMDQKLKNYSSGMQVRLAFALAIRSDADILLIDEVLAVGDADFQKKCFEYFKGLKKDKKTVVFISHDMSAIQEFCTRAVCIDNGKIIAEGEVSKVAESYMRLFQKDTQSSTHELNSERWGSKSLQMSSPSVRVSENELVVKLTISADVEVSEYTLGFSVHDRDTGEILLGTNSELLGKRLPAMKKSQEKTFSFTLPNVLRDGVYDLGLALHAPKNLPVYDWWDKALVVESFYGRKSPYLITPKVRLTVD